MDKSLIEKFFKGQATNDERRRFMEWVHSDASEMEVVQEVKRYFKGTSGQTFLWDDEEVLKKLQLRIMAMEPREKHGQPKHPARRFNIARFLKVAAMLFLVSAIVILMWQSYVEHPAQPKTDAMAMLTKSTGRGQKLSFYLDDGSKVMLNAGSKITFPSKFTGNERRVALEGEAYFEVVKDVSKPFIVMSGNYLTKVLGTSFVVDASKENGQISIGLRSGKVKVEKTGDQNSKADAVILTPGEMLNVDLMTNKEHIGHFEDVAMFGWTDGILYFKDASFKEVTDRLAQWYDVRFAVNSPRHIDKKYSGKYVNETLDNVLKGLSFVDGFDYSIDGKNVAIKFRKP